MRRLGELIRQNDGNWRAIGFDLDQTKVNWWSIGSDKGRLGLIGLVIGLE